MTGIRRSRVPFCGVWERDTWEISTDRNLIRKAREQKREVQFSLATVSCQTKHSTVRRVFFEFFIPPSSTLSIPRAIHDVCVARWGLTSDADVYIGT